MATINDYSALSENAKILFHAILARVDDEAWVHSTQDLDMTITINGVEVKDLDAFLEKFMAQVELYVDEQSAEKIIDRFDDLARRYNDEFIRAREVVVDIVEKAFDVKIEDQH